MRPLVIHGGTGLSDEQFRLLIAGGVSKINDYTTLSDVAGRRIRGNIEQQGGYTGLLEGAHKAISEEVERCMRLWGIAGKAADVLAAIPAVRAVITGEAVKAGSAYPYTWLVNA